MRLIVVLSILLASCSMNSEPNLKHESLDGSGGGGGGSVILVSKADNFRGHTASFTETTDAIANPGFVSGEYFLLKYNLGGTIFDLSSTAPRVAMYQFGRVDFADYLHNNFTAIDAMVTTTRGGVNPSCLSYGGGTTSYKLAMLPLLLGGRNSDSAQVSQFGQTDVNFISRPSSFRWEYCIKNAKTDYAYRNALGCELLNGIVRKKILNHEWYQHFMHWAYNYQDNYTQYYDTLTALIGNADVYRGSYNKVLEYAWVRDAVDSIKATGNTITVYYSKKYPGSPYNKIHTPLWVNLDVSGTALAGGGISSTGGKVRSMGSDKYVAAVDLDFSIDSVSFDISATATPTYVDLTKPIISISGNVVTSNVPVKIALFSKTNAQYEFEMLLNERKTTYSTSHTLSTSMTLLTKKYRVGAITAEGISCGLNVN